MLEPVAIALYWITRDSDTTQPLKHFAKHCIAATLPARGGWGRSRGTRPARRRAASARPSTRRRGSSRARTPAAGALRAPAGAARWPRGRGRTAGGGSGGTGPPGARRRTRRGGRASLLSSSSSAPLLPPAVRRGGNEERRGWRWPWVAVGEWRWIRYESVTARWVFC